MDSRVSLKTTCNGLSDTVPLVFLSDPDITDTDPSFFLFHSREISTDFAYKSPKIAKFLMELETSTNRVKNTCYFLIQHKQITNLVYG